MGDDPTPATSPRVPPASTSTQSPDDDDDVLPNPARPARSALYRAMTSYGRELCCFAVLMLGAWATLQPGPPKTRPANPPGPFFNVSSLVTDHYDGKLDGDAFRRHDISVVLYYAPWDGLSLRARVPFAATARQLHREVNFVAVNCWWPLGECRKTYSPSFFPVIVAHVRDHGDVMFPLRGGVLVEKVLMRFVRRLMTPLVHVTSAAELDVLLGRHAAVLVGAVDGVLDGAYNAFYALATQAVGRDPWDDVAFAVVTNRRAAERIGIEHALTLRTWNATLGEIFGWRPEAKVLTIKLLLQVVHWVWPSGLKSNTLSTLVENRSALVLFAERHSRQYFELQELAREYHTCGGIGTLGMGCRGNGTLRFIAMDPVEHPEFAPPGLLSSGGDTGAVVYASKEEAQYVLRGPVDADALKRLVRGFDGRTLTRHLNSAGPSRCLKEDVVCEMNGPSFRRLMADQTQDALVLFYASWCGFCKGIFHHYFSAAKFFQGFSGLLFARIDAVKNDLPWEFTMEQYPTVMFFPAHRKGDSVPYKEPVTTVNLVRFVLRHVRHDVAWQLLRVMCYSRSCLVRNLHKVRRWMLPGRRRGLSWRQSLEASRRARTLHRILLHRLLSTNS
ncbi:unnamed protein product [Ixodes hexagonus]